YESPPILNAALAIYRNQTSAHEAVNASPIRFHLQHENDGWTSKISQDASRKGPDRETNEKYGTQVSQALGETTETTLANSETITEQVESQHKEEKSWTESSHPPANPPASETQANRNADDKWESKFLRNVLEREATVSKDKDASELGTFSPSFERPHAVTNGSSTTMRAKKPGPKIADELTATFEATSHPPKKEQDSMQAVPVKEFELVVAPSVINHQAYIERQGYYAGFKPDMRTIMAADLMGRVPLEGLVDCRLNKADVPLRQRLQKKDRRPVPTLRELWDTGRKARGEV
ncbi:MAG: hypothetical protein Q9183_004282, partial [Haloplaca sp. 2 TL-2023]